jgi:hypothetical protein
MRTAANAQSCVTCGSHRQSRHTTSEQNITSQTPRCLGSGRPVAGSRKVRLHTWVLPTGVVAPILHLLAVVIKSCLGIRHQLPPQMPSRSARRWHLAASGSGVTAADYATIQRLTIQSLTESPLVAMITYMTKCLCRDGRPAVPRGLRYTNSHTAHLPRNQRAVTRTLLQSRAHVTPLQPHTVWP